jgi:hypothetical protein
MELRNKYRTIIGRPEFDSASIELNTITKQPEIKLLNVF